MRQQRTAAGLTQAALASRAGVSRQLVGAVEAGRHLPRVDAAAALARALGVAVEALLDEHAPTTVTGVLGALPAVGTPVAVGQVGELLVAASVPAGQGWATAGGVVTETGVELLPGERPGTVVVGCDPSIELAARLATEQGGDRVLAVAASSSAAMAALAAGRAHAAVVHGPRDRLPAGDDSVQRRHLASWVVGLAAPADAPAGWWREALAGRRAVVQREDGAATQSALERAVAAAGGVLGMGVRAGGHAEAARTAQLSGTTAITIEPVARSFGMAFHPLEEHLVHLWVGRSWVGGRGMDRFGEAVVSPAFQRCLEAVGGYDLRRTGDLVAA